MADIWDDAIKRLFREHPQDFVSWLVKDAIYDGAVSGELKNRTRRADILVNIVQRETRKTGLLHAEVQSKDDENIVERLQEYNLMSTLTYRKPVISFLILLRPMPGAPASPAITALFDEIEIWRFHYVVIRLWEIPAEELLRSGLIGLLPLVPLTKGGTEQETLLMTVTELAAAKEYDLLALAKLIAGLITKGKIAQETLERMFAMYHSILEDSWVYQELIQRGREEGMEKGMEKGIEKGLDKGLTQGEQRALLAMIQKRFPDILESARELVSDISNSGTLENLVVEVSVAQNSQEALQAIRAVRK
jgi:predicted transposase YdaD